MTRIQVLLLSCLCILPRPALADGGLFVHEVSSETTQSLAVSSSQLTSDGQRALYLQRDGGWDLYVQPGKMAVAGAAWVLPVPTDIGEGDVAEAPALLLDQLEFATSPLFEITIEQTLFCPEQFYSSSSSCDVRSTGAVGADGSGGPTTVDVNGVRPAPGIVRWGEGTVAGWDFVIVDANSADDLVAWLTENGYAKPDGLSDRVKPYVDKGWRFFCATFTRDSDAPEQLPLVRFRLDGLAAPVYPMLLTPLSVSGNWKFELFVAAEEGYGPASGLKASGLGDVLQGGLGYLSDYDGDGDFDALPYAYELFKSRLDELLQGDGPGTLAAVEYFGPLTEKDISDRASAWLADSDGTGGTPPQDEKPVGKPGEPRAVEPDASSFGASDAEGPQDPASGWTEPPLSGTPESWPEEIRDITERKLVVTRLLGRAFEGVDKDIAFEAGGGKLVAEDARFAGTGMGELWLDPHDPRCRPGYEAAQAGLLGPPANGAPPSGRAQRTGMIVLALLLAAAMWTAQAATRRRFAA